MLVCAFLCTVWHTRPRVQRAPGIPCALCFEGRQRICITRAKSRREIAESWRYRGVDGDIVSRALRSMERLRNDALQTRDPGVWGWRDGSRLCGAPLKKRCTASGTRRGGAGHDDLYGHFPSPKNALWCPTVFTP